MRQKLVMPPNDQKEAFIDRLIKVTEDDRDNGARNISTVHCRSYIEFASKCHRNWLQAIKSSQYSSLSQMHVTQMNQSVLFMH